MESFKKRLLELDKVKWLFEHKHQLTPFEVSILEEGREWSWRISTQKIEDLYNTMLFKTLYVPNAEENNLADEYIRQLAQVKLLIEEIRRDYEHKIDLLNKNIKILATRISK
jgi:hypothetical protein